MKGHRGAKAVSDVKTPYDSNRKVLSCQLDDLTPWGVTLSQVTDVVPNRELARILDFRFNDFLISTTWSN